MGLEKISGDSAEDSEIGGGGRGFSLPVILIEDDIEHPMQGVFNAPMSANSGGSGMDRGKAGDEETRLGGRITAFEEASALNEEKTVEVLPVLPIGEP